jgi:hypothetical protein
MVIGQAGAHQLIVIQFILVAPGPATVVGLVIHGQDVSHRIIFIKPGIRPHGLAVIGMGEIFAGTVIKIVMGF